MNGIDYEAIVYRLFDALWLPACPLLDKISATENERATLDYDHLCLRCFYVQLGMNRLYGWKKLAQSLFLQHAATPGSVLIQRQDAFKVAEGRFPPQDFLEGRRRRFPVLNKKR